MPGELSAPGSVAATPTPYPVLHAEGTLIYFRGGNLYAGALDGSGEKQLSHTGKSVTYAGQVTSTTGTWIYYTQLAGSDAPPSSPPSAGSTLELFRTKLGDPASEQTIMPFDRKKIDPVSSPPPGFATISPDGSEVAYSANDGLHLVHLATMADELLLATHPCMGAAGCVGYADAPQWSADGRWLLVLRVFYETGVAVLLDPAHPQGARAITQHGANVGDGFQHWAPASDAFCVSGVSNGLGGAGLLSAHDPTFHDLGEAFPVPADEFGRPEIYSFSCAWSPDGRIAMGYEPYTDPTMPGAPQLAIFDAAGRLERVVALPQPYYWYNTITWLPDGSGVVLAHGDKSGGIAMLLDGKPRDLPFDAEFVVAAVSG